MLNNTLENAYIAVKSTTLQDIFTNQPLQVISTNTQYPDSLIDKNPAKRIVLNTIEHYIGPYSNSGIHLTDLPTIFPYHINGNDDKVHKYYDYGFVSIPIAIKLPINSINATDFMKNFPPEIVEILNKFIESGLQIEFGFCVQNTPWISVKHEIIEDNDTTNHNPEILLLRTHLWLYPDAPQNGNYTLNSNILVSIANIHDPLAELTKLREESVTIHPTDIQNNLQMIFSPNNIPIPMSTSTGINFFQHNHALYSICVDSINCKAIITLHWLLNQESYRCLITSIADKEQVILQKVMDTFKHQYFAMPTTNDEDKLNFKAMLDNLTTLFLGKNAITAQNTIIAQDLHPSRELTNRNLAHQQLKYKYTPT